MKLSISLPDFDIKFLDGYAHSHGIESRSAAIQRAIRLLRATDLGDAYEAAWDEWEQSGDDEAWETTVADGLVRK
jgi:Arc/MetJ-type ribon-helix-helix transcriptional regulator